MIPLEPQEPTFKTCIFMYLMTKALHGEICVIFVIRYNLYFKILNIETAKYEQRQSQYEDVFTEYGITNFKDDSLTFKHAKL